MVDNAQVLVEIEAMLAKSPTLPKTVYTTANGPRETCESRKQNSAYLAGMTSLDIVLLTSFGQEGGRGYHRMVSESVFDRLCDKCLCMLGPAAKCVTYAKAPV
jgi:hypothetical protein